MSQERKSEIRKNDLHRAVDGELTKKETERLKAVLREDPGTRAELDSLKRVTETTQQVVRPVAPPPDLRARIMDKLRKSGKP